jgi:peptidylprolyl isomerase/FKBP-type peptidyl-prolyl cis-trans isomerase FklB
MTDDQKGAVAGKSLAKLALAGVLLALAACAEAPTAPSSANPSDPWATGAPGVTTLQGVKYKILKSGPVIGVHPRRSDDIVVRYEGRLTDGTVFDSSKSDKAGVSTFPLGRLIPGWIAAVQLMRPGDEWLIYIPAYMAYGEKGAGPIPSNADLVFRIELVSVSPKK